MKEMSRISKEFLKIRSAIKSPYKGINNLLSNLFWFNMMVFSIAMFYSSPDFLFVLQLIAAIGIFWTNFKLHAIFYWGFGVTAFTFASIICMIFGHAAIPIWSSLWWGNITLIIRKSDCDPIEELFHKIYVGVTKK